MLFDAIGYLGQIDPTQNYEIDILTGGSMNVTLRATKTGSYTNGGRFPGQPSLVLKYAPPFVAAIGEQRPVTTYRQVIEARALSLFSDDRKDALCQICSETSVMVPKLLHHDPDANVLIMSDLGSLPNLATVCSDLGGLNLTPFPRDLPPSAQPSLSSECSAERVSHYNTIGARMGSFFAKLHSSKSLSVILLDPQRGPKFLDNFHLGNYIFENFIKPIKGWLEVFPNLLSQDEASILYERLAKNVTRPTLDEEQSFVLGDCWPGALLVSSFTPSAPEQAPKVGVVDWEFAKIGRGLNGDVAQLMARLAVLQYAADFKKDGLRLEEINALASAITTSYRRMSVEGGALWTRGSGEVGGEQFADLHEDSLRAKILRSMFLAHASEMVRCAFGKSWNCQNERCDGVETHTTRKHECLMIQRMVERALWYLRHAGENEREFCSRENFTVLQEAYRDGRWLLDLF